MLEAMAWCEETAGLRQGRPTRGAKEEIGDVRGVGAWQGAMRRRGRRGRAGALLERGEEEKEGGPHKGLQGHGNGLGEDRDDEVGVGSATEMRSRRRGLRAVVV